MTRSEINDAILGAAGVLDDHGWHLSVWADQDNQRNGTTSAFLPRHQMGWDAMDLGCGHSGTSWLTLFCLRRIQGHQGERTFAEKLMFMEEGQETPAHRHLEKSEDTINRAGVVLVAACALADGPLTALVDGGPHQRVASGPLHSRPGKSATLERDIDHRFCGRQGNGPASGSEVSRVYDDTIDKYSLSEIGRFAAIEEEPPLGRLWNEEVKIAAPSS